MTRPRGFAPYKPQAKTVAFIDQIQAVTAMYSFAITVRQVFYRLIATAEYGKTEQGYNNLGEVIGRARRAGIIPMDAIRDDGFTGGVGEHALLADEGTPLPNKLADRHAALNALAAFRVKNRLAHAYALRRDLDQLVRRHPLEAGVER